ncbi:hypothetical protein [Arenicella xantha]|uniref:D-alanyl-lipoteichoic acid acyltransferase DltB (MBOAT superfamily) n=1 Tax=Arenicella xantha TaxID=644221 RepID=A0A395JMU7_9GAMM|nr:hypothetical protein [Arenicella xantha]RBP52960.1 D-alanyl-lipoteichoic acid acyltransferase DltB (MBOAT superfamily) [Arenicella xantha]
MNSKANSNIDNSFAGFNSYVADLGQYGLLIFQLLIIAAFIHHFNVESAFNLPLLFLLVIGAFVLRFFIPSTYRQWFFVLVTIGALLIVLAWQQTLIFLAIALTMIGVCNLPIHLKWRQFILLGIAIWLGVIRFGFGVQWLASSTLILLSSMFMFRMLLLLFELKHQKEAVPIATQVSYFLMLPNVIFPLFPVVDYKLFQRNYLSSIDIERCQRGVYLIAKGVLYLFVYRLIYSFLIPSKSDVDSPQAFMVYISLSYLLTIRLAGIFHFSVGVLHLFGYKLPDVFNNHFFASSFSDLWRRLNIYWKEFIAKLFFNPLYFMLRTYGAKRAIFISTIAAFIATMIFHQYQSFWLTGVFEVQGKDLVFWGVLGSVVACQSLIKVKRPASSLSTSILLMAKVCLTFSLVSLLWSIWISEGLSQWFEFTKNAMQVSLSGLLGLGAVVFLMVVGGGCLYHFAQHLPFTKHKRLIHHLPIVLLLILVVAFNQQTLSVYWNKQLAGNDIHRIFNFVLTKEDSQREIASYYDNILTVGDLMTPIMRDSVTKSKMFQKGLYSKEILVASEDALKRVFTPSSQMTLQGIDVSINKWGMYDKEYSLLAPDDTYRVAFLGGSIEMGWAIPVEQGLDKLIEARLNEEAIFSKSQYTNIEILNFSVPSRNILNHRYALNNHILSFKPHMVVIFDHDEHEWLNIVNGFQEYDYSQDFNGVVGEIYTSIQSLQRKTFTELMFELEQFRERLFHEAYSDIYAVSVDNDIFPVVVSMPELRTGHTDVRYNHAVIAESIGYEFIDLTSIFNGSEVEDLVMDSAGHPNLSANGKIAAELYVELLDTITRRFEIVRSLNDNNEQ